MKRTRLLMIVFFACLVPANTLAAQEPTHAQEPFLLPPAKAGVPYEYSLRSEGGLPPLQWKIIAGELPQGIDLVVTGVLKGLPLLSREQPFDFTVEVRNSEHPPQSCVQRLRLTVTPSELHIVLPAALLRIVPAENSENVGLEPPLTFEAREAVVRPVTYNQQRSPHWVVPLQLSVTSPAAQVLRANDSKNQQANTSPKKPLDPATFIKIIEDTKVGGHYTRYEPVQQGTKQVVKEGIKQPAVQFAVDLESSVLIEPDPAKMGDDPALNKLFVTAKLASGDTSKDVVVTGYSEIGKDKSAMAAQSGTAFQSAANVEAMIFNMAYTAGDIIRTVYQSHVGGKTDTQESFQEWVTSHREVDFQGKQVLDIDDAISKAVLSNAPFSDPTLQRLRDRLRLYRPEIQAISDFFVQRDNLAIVERVGVTVFWIDRNSLQAIAQQYKDNIQIAFDSKSSTESAQAQALKDLLERTKLVYKDFGEYRRDIRNRMSTVAAGTRTDEEWNTKFEDAILAYSHQKRSEAFTKLKSYLATGSISLPDYQAKDGDRLTVTVESVPADSTTGGVPVVFQIAIKKYGAKIQWSPSLLFVRRLGVTDAEVTPPAGSTAAPLNRVNFAPSPGMTFGVAYFKRGQNGGDKFLRALGPGLGMNVTFMNFNDPSYDLTTGKFVNTTGTNVQIGAGVIGSLFDNKIQFCYGWNLNVERRRNYVGIGFGFIEIGKEVAKYVGK